MRHGQAEQGRSPWGGGRMWKETMPNSKTREGKIGESGCTLNRRRTQTVPGKVSLRGVVVRGCFRGINSRRKPMKKKTNEPKSLRRSKERAKKPPGIREVCGEERASGTELGDVRQKHGGTRVYRVGSKCWTGIAAQKGTASKKNGQKGGENGPWERRQIG